MTATTGKSIEELIETAYAAFNSRNIEDALRTFHEDVEWPKAFEGGYVQGHNEIRKYWTRQWAEIDPNVAITGILKRADGSYEVGVHQVVKDLDGNTLFDGNIKHIYIPEGNLLRRMDIELE